MDPDGCPKHLGACCMIQKPDAKLIAIVLDRETMGAKPQHDSLSRFRKVRKNRDITETLLKKRIQLQGLYQ
jgi:hypothetical protein